MKKLIIFTVALMFIMTNVTMAEDVVSISEWLEAFGVTEEQTDGQTDVQDQPLAEETPLAEEDAYTPEFTPISVGSSGEDVEQLQNILIELGLLDGSADGVFDRSSKKALKALQKKFGWKQTGAIETEDEWNAIMALLQGDGVNLAMGTSVALTLTPSGKNTWCSPTGFYPTSPDGLASLADTDTVFTVSFDWSVEEADKKVNASISLKYTDTKYASVGRFNIPAGNSNGHFSGSFIPTDAMRAFGNGWIISRIGKGTVNRDMKITISNFKFERGMKASEWSMAPEDESDDINLAMGTGEPATVAPAGENNWCSPGKLFPTSPNGLAAIADKNNGVFTVSFDWTAVGADTEAVATISLKYTEKKYKKVGEFPIAVGSSSGHFTGSFIPGKGMREYGTDWLISGMGSTNRNIQITISNFKFERGANATAWTAAPEDNNTEQ